jgi:hypothetical protein
MAFRRLFWLSAPILACVACAGHQAPNPDVPPAATFDRVLSLAVLAYFTSGQSSPVGISYELLRTQPTITGLAYPKYYVWVEVRSGSQLVQAGAARLEAIKGSLGVTDFLPAEDIRRDTSTVSAVFPMAMVGAITRRARGVHLPPKRGA